MNNNEGVKITGIDIPLFQMMWFLVTVMIAAIPAMIIATLFFVAIYGIVAALLV